MSRKMLAILVALLVSFTGIGAASAATAGKGPVMVVTKPSIAPVDPSVKAAAVLPVGQYPNGHVVQCVQTATPYQVKGHAGAESKDCPSGNRKLTFVTTNPGAGPAGPVGPVGPAGAKGETGPAGAAGQAAPVLPYGIGKVNIKRGTNPATTWATASTTVGGPDGDTASNTFRMTCSAANAPCVVTASARATVDGIKVYPRLLITKSSIDTGAPVGLCEYADGTDNDNGTDTVGPAGAVLDLGIGGSLDCGSDQVKPASGVVQDIRVPAGYYDIAATFTFSK